MRTIVAGRHAASKEEFAELALGVDTELFTGPAGPEPLADRAARLAAAEDILDVLRREDPELAAHAENLMRRTTRATAAPTAGAGCLRLVVDGNTRSGKHFPVATLLGLVAA
ncbi:hypothetical protein ACIPYS_06530 [Kitasatospora sp. NPDC089913]|uniref:hypothetical protein n=1 Tax=Kitasatospora sp. NPDC089913 TaxID=3364080 RepID=UPI0037F6163C